MAKRIKTGAGYVVLLDLEESAEQCGHLDIAIMKVREWYVLHLVGNDEMVELSQHLSKDDAITATIDAAEFLKGTYPELGRPQVN